MYCSNSCRSKGYRQGRRDTNASRRPLPDFAKDSAWRLRRDVDRLERVFADDRFRAYKHQVGAELRAHLEYAAEVCQDLLSRLNEIGE